MSVGTESKHAGPATCRCGKETPGAVGAAFGPNASRAREMAAHVADLRMKGMTTTEVARAAGVDPDWLFSALKGPVGPSDGAKASAVLSVRPPNRRRPDSLLKVGSSSRAERAILGRMWDEGRRAALARVLDCSVRSGASEAATLEAVELVCGVGRPDAREALEAVGFLPATLKFERH